LPARTARQTYGQLLAAARAGDQGLAADVAAVLARGEGRRAADQEAGQHRLALGDLDLAQQLALAAQERRRGGADAGVRRVPLFLRQDRQFWLLGPLPLVARNAHALLRTSADHLPEGDAADVVFAVQHLAHAAGLPLVRRDRPALVL
jgi:hypothetical protein